MMGQYAFVCELFERTCSKHSSKVVFFFLFFCITFQSVRVGSVDRYGVIIHV